MKTDGWGDKNGDPPECINPFMGGQKAFPFSGNSLEKFFGAACKRDSRERAMAGKEIPTLQEDT